MEIQMQNYIFRGLRSQNDHDEEIQVYRIRMGCQFFARSHQNCRMQSVDARQNLVLSRHGSGRPAMGMAREQTTRILHHPRKHLEVFPTEHLILVSPGGLLLMLVKSKLFLGDDRAAQKLIKSSLQISMIGVIVSAIIIG